MTWLCSGFFFFFFSSTSTRQHFSGAPAGEHRGKKKKLSPLSDLSRFHYNLVTSRLLDRHSKRLKERKRYLEKSIDVCYAKEWVDGKITPPSAKVLATVPRGHIFIFTSRDELVFTAVLFVPVCRQSFSLLVNADSPNPVFPFLSSRLSGRHLQFG